MNFIVIIPARYHSKRFLGKPLAKVCDNLLVLSIMKKAKLSGAKRVIVATDHKKIYKVVKSSGGEACLTYLQHRSGTERLSEVIEKYNISDDQIVVNIQVDEFFINSKIIRDLVKKFICIQEKVLTLSIPIENFEEATDINTVKVIFDKNKSAIYFSRSIIPFVLKEDFVNKKEFFPLFRHVGIYVYRANFIRYYVNLPISYLEKIESLEQLRILWNGEKIHVLQKNIYPYVSINTPKDIEKIQEIFKKTNS